MIIKLVSTGYLSGIEITTARDMKHKSKLSACNNYINPINSKKKLNQVDIIAYNKDTFDQNYV